MKGVSDPGGQVVVARGGPQPGEIEVRLLWAAAVCPEDVADARARDGVVDEARLEFGQQRRVFGHRHEALCGLRVEGRERLFEQRPSEVDESEAGRRGW